MNRNKILFSLFFTLTIFQLQIGSTMAMKLSSPSFENNKDIPQKYTCQGADISPQLRWSDLPEGTKSLALIVDDPDAPDPKAPKMTYVHWVLFNIPPTTDFIEEGAKTLPNGTKEGINDWNKTGYGGPCPPIGTHRYFFKLYALNTELKLNKPNKKDLEKAMEGHILGKTEIVGTYKKK